VQQLSNQVASGVPADKLIQAPARSSFTSAPTPWGAPLSATLQSLTPAQAALFAALSVPHTWPQGVLHNIPPVTDENHQQAANKALAQVKAVVEAEMSGDKSILAGAIASQTRGVAELQVCKISLSYPSCSYWTCRKQQPRILGFVASRHEDICQIFWTKSRTRGQSCFGVV
jgi:hypothetical protein